MKILRSALLATSFSASQTYPPPQSRDTLCMYSISPGNPISVEKNKTIQTQQTTLDSKSKFQYTHGLMYTC